ncbi:MAG TPA: hypothetical protein PK987_01735 [Ferruginibacter sp.]|nr:hypothetical protein [Ferruginibacter sp.]
MIYVFKTSVKYKTQVKNQGLHIEKMLPGTKWNFDLDDCDKILRIDSDRDIVIPIIILLKNHQFICEELK